jgi:peptide/nickel transport system permease protein
VKKYILKRVLQALVCLIGVTLIVFYLTRVSGDPVLLMVPPEATKADIQAMRVSLGLDKPVYHQYASFLFQAIRLDLGKSIRWNRPTVDLFWERFPNTLTLALAAMAFAVLLGIPMGILAAKGVGKGMDNLAKIFALLGQGMPVFWVGLILILIFSVKLKILPTSGIGGWQHLILPSVTLGWFFAASFTRMSRSAMLDVLDSEYIKMARIMGLRESAVIWKYGLKNAAIPILTLGAVNFAMLLNGAVVVETVFNWPGVGKLILDGILARDFPVVQACVLFSSVFYIFTNLAVDLLYGYIDPRIRYQ